MALTDAFLRFAVDLHTPAVSNAPVFLDPALQKTLPDVDALAGRLGSTSDLRPVVSDTLRSHPIYEGLRAALQTVRSDPSYPAGDTLEQEAALLLNLDRARTLPGRTSGRHIVVDVAGQRLLAFEGGDVRETMKVVVGKASMPTPVMIGRLSHAIVNPYWNLPPDLARQRLSGSRSEAVANISRHHMEVLSDWSDKSRPLAPDEIPWSAALNGQVTVRMRQKPGPDNMMGKVKFMMPNPLGIYLHDTPLRGDFSLEDRALSAGCIRLEDPARLSAWLFGNDVLATPMLETRVELAEPMAVYVVYLTVFPEPDGALRNRPDFYGRDLGSVAKQTA
jgi:murein L,D-transpeptidase YcbB/YkuD